MILVLLGSTIDFCQSMNKDGHSGLRTTSRIMSWTSTFNALRLVAIFFEDCLNAGSDIWHHNARVHKFMNRFFICSMGDGPERSRWFKGLFCCVNAGDLPRSCRRAAPPALSKSWRGAFHKHILITRILSTFNSVNEIACGSPVGMRDVRAMEPPGPLRCPQCRPPASKAQLALHQRVTHDLL